MALAAGMSPPSSAWRMRLEETGLPSYWAMGSTCTSTPSGAQSFCSRAGSPAAFTPKVKFSPQ